VRWTISGSKCVLGYDTYVEGQMPTQTGDRWQLLSQHLDQLLDLAHEQRAPWLEALAERDPEMAAQLSEALAATERGGFTGFLQGAPPLPVEDMANATLVGLQVGPYVIDAELGHGGMGSVWRARRTDGRFEGFVAVKFVHAAWRGGDGEKRFRVEGNLLGRLDHPNIARLIDAGVLTGTQPYLILEYIEGEPIDAFCEREKLDLEARIKLFLDVLAAVAHAHSFLIVHRDLKPSNIFVTRGGVVKLLDFGVAKLLQAETGAAAATKSVEAALTPRYAAPEQVLGKPVTTATDVYSLGLVLYVLLTGTHPVSTDSASGADLMRAVLQQEPAKASTACTVAMIPRRSLQGDLDNILSKALKKDQQERYESVGAFADDLRRYLTDEPVQACADTAAYRVAKFVRRHRAGVVIAFLVTTGLIGTSAVALWQLRRANVERDIARDEVRRGRALDELNTFMLTESSTHAAPGEIRQRLDHAVDFVERNFGEKDVAASLLFGLAGSYTDIGEAELASKITAKADAIAEQIGDLDLQTEAACRRAHDFAIAHNFPDAKARLAEAQKNMPRLRGIPPGLRASCGIAAALVAQADGDYANAIVNLRTVIISLEQEELYGYSGWTAAKNELARSQYMAGDFRGAVATDSDNMRVMKARGLTDRGRYFATASLVCNALRQGGRPAQSRSFVDSTLAEVRQVVPGAQLPFFMTGCRALAEVSMGLPSPPTAILADATRTARSAGTLSIANTYGAALVNEAVNRGDPAAAESYWADLAVDEKRMLDAAEHGPDVVRLLLAHANLAMAQGRTSEAAVHINQAAELMAARHQTTSADARDVAMTRVRLAFATRQFANAVAYAQAALDIARGDAIDPKSSAWIGEALLWRARAEAALGDKAKATATAQEALPHLEQNFDPTSTLIAGARALIAS
jgi:serine/threonine protein kinase/tetratricopeptide (TPR) repeat protein